MMSLRTLLSALLLLLLNVKEGESIPLNVVGNDADTPIVIMQSGIGKYVPILHAPLRKNSPPICLSRNSVIQSKEDRPLDDALPRRNNSSPSIEVSFVRSGAISASVFLLPPIQRPPEADLFGIRPANVRPTRIEIPSDLLSVWAIDRNDLNSVLPHICSDLNYRQFLLPLCSLQLPLDSAKLADGHVSHIFKGASLDSCCGDELISLRRGRPHFVQLGLRDGAADYRDAKSAESNYGCCYGRDGSHPFWGVQFWKYIFAFFSMVLAFASMLLAYFWLLFAVAVPKGIKFRWMFDGFNVHMWSPRRRGMVALAFFLISVALIITAVRLAFPHRDLPKSHPLNQISSIRTV